MIFVPYQTDVRPRVFPWGNYFFIGCCVACYMVEAAGRDVRPLVLTGVGLPGLFTHMFVHADVLHLLGNMLVLWVFGNAVCAKIGNEWYAAYYLGLGVLSALAHLWADGGPAVGASGAINGVVGAFLVLYPKSTVRCWWTIYIRAGRVSVPAYALILVWFLMDVAGNLGGEGNIAYLAHLGGFAAGFVSMTALLMSGLLRADPGEATLVEILGG